MVVGTLVDPVGDGVAGVELDGLEDGLAGSLGGEGHGGGGGEVAGGDGVAETVNGLPLAEVVETGDGGGWGAIR